MINIPASTDQCQPCQVLKYLLVNFILSSLLVGLTGCAASPSPQWRWQRAEAGLPRQAITLAVAADPTDPKRVWAGSYTPGGLARSDDGGQTWTTETAGRAGNPIFDLLATASPTFSAEGEQRHGATLWAATRTGLLQSTDGSVTWQVISAGLPAMPVLALAADASGRVYAGLDKAGIYAQTEQGAWASLAPPLTSAEGELGSAGVLSLAVSADGQQLYAGTAGLGLFASQDGGQTWRSAEPGAYAPNLALDPARPQVALASLRDRLVRTQDGGKSWQTLPLAWAHELVVSLLWRADGALGAGTGQGRLYYSPDGGDTWIEGGAGLPRGEGVLDLATTSEGLLAATWTGLYGSDNGGESWQYLTPAQGYPNATALLATRAALWLGTRTGLFRWQADSQRWLPVPADLPPGGITALAVDPSNPQVLYAGSSGDGLYRSDDGGSSWQRVPTLGVGVPAVAVDPQNSRRVYILAAWERVYETRDGGQSWLARWEGMGITTEAVSLAVDPLYPNVYVGADSGLYRSHDGGHWHLVAPALADQTVLALLVQPTPPGAGQGSVLYLGTTRGVYRSLTHGATVQGGDEAKRRGGETWGQGLENISVTALLADPNNPAWLYAGTAYNGIYQSVDWGFTWQAIGPPELSEGLVEELAWGPEGELFAAAAGGVWVGVKE